MTTDNTQSELDEILALLENGMWNRDVREGMFGRSMTRAKAKQAILDLQNKRIEAVLDRLATQRGILSDPVHGEKSIPVSAIEAERNKLKEEV